MLSFIKFILLFAFCILLLVFYVFPRQVFYRIKWLFTDFRFWVILGVLISQAWIGWAGYHSYAKFNDRNEHHVCGLAKAISHSLPKTLLFANPQLNAATTEILNNKIVYNKWTAAFSVEQRKVCTDFFNAFFNLVLPGTTYTAGLPPDYDIELLYSPL